MIANNMIMNITRFFCIKSTKWTTIQKFFFVKSRKSFKYVFACIFLLNFSRHFVFKNKAPRRSRSSPPGLRSSSLYCKPCFLKSQPVDSVDKVAYYITEIPPSKKCAFGTFFASPLPPEWGLCLTYCTFYCIAMLKYVMLYLPSCTHATR